MRRISKNLYYSLFLSYLIIIIIFISIFGLYVYRNIFSLLEEKTVDYNDKVIGEIHKDIDNYFLEIKKLTYVAYTPEMTKLLDNVDNTKKLRSWDFIEAKNDFFEAFNSWIGIYNLKSEISSIFVILPDKVILEQSAGKIDSDSQFLTNIIYNKAISLKGDLSFLVEDTSKFFKYYQKDDYSKSLVIFRKLQSVEPIKDLGVLVVTIKWNDIEKIINEIISNEPGNYLLLDENYNTIFKTEGVDNKTIKTIQNNLNSTKSNDHLIINSYKSEISNWSFYGIQEIETINHDIFFIKKLILISTIIAIVISLLSTLLFSKSIIRPINKLKNYAQLLKNGVFDTTLSLNSYNQFNILANAFNHTSLELKNKIRQNYELALREREAELNALQAKINPHFLYNTLNTINAYAKLIDAREISQMTLSLSDILRYSIQSSKHLVRIKEEIEHINNYLYIQNIRYDQQIHTIFNLDRKYTNKKTIRFIIQPIVENALYHGLEPKHGYKELQISVTGNEANVFIEVTDNGLGMDEETCNFLSSYIDNGEQSFSNNKFGEGIRNVNQRIKLSFGNNYGLKISSKRLKGTKVIITLPSIS